MTLFIYVLITISKCTFDEPTSGRVAAYSIDAIRKKFYRFLQGGMVNSKPLKYNGFLSLLMLTNRALAIVVRSSNSAATKT